jgi:hypothetical protein
MGFADSFGTDDVGSPISIDESGAVSQDGVSLGYSVDDTGNVRGTSVYGEASLLPPTLTQKVGGLLSDAVFVKNSDGTINWGLTALKGGSSMAGGPLGMLGFGVGRAGLALMSYDRDGDIAAELTAQGKPSDAKAVAEYYAEERGVQQALDEANVSPSIPQYLLSQGQQDPAAQQTASALFGPTHVYGALPGQRQRRGAYQYIPPTFGPRS